MTTAFAPLSTALLQMHNYKSDSRENNGEAKPES